MASQHVPYSTSTNYGAAVSSGLKRFETALEDLNKLRASLELMIDAAANENESPGSHPDHFADVRTALGTADNADAKAVYDELAAGLSRLNTDGAVSGVQAAHRQMCNKLRQG